MLVGAIFIALYFPLSPGILSLEADGVKVGESTFGITGYNTHFKTEDLQVWMNVDEFSFCPTSIKAMDETHISVTAVFPSKLPSRTLNVFVNNRVDGTLVNIQQLYVKEAEVDRSLERTACHSPITTSDHGYFSLPFRTILYETIRNLNLHVPMWFAMIVMMMLSLVSAILYLVKSDSRYDDMTVSAIRIGLLFALCGLATGSVWARFTWTNWWTDDPQLNGAAISTLGYLAYFILRRAIDDPEKKSRLSSVYAIFAFVMFYVFVKVIPGQAEFSLHPNTTDNPSFRDYDVEGKLKTVFYIASTGWIILSAWLFSLEYRLARLIRKRDARDETI